VAFRTFGIYISYFKQDTSEIPMAVIVAAGKMLCRTVVETYEEGFGHKKKAKIDICISLNS
jgi:hypothetical protein